MAHPSIRAARSSLRRIAAAVAALGILASAATNAHAAWERAHGDGANTGFADVATAPAGAGSLTVPGLGTFAPGAGPVIAPDGTVILATREGKVIGLRADGKPYWSRALPTGRSILASPAIDPDGSVFVIGVEMVSDARNKRRSSKLELYRFNTSGAQLGGGVPFPEHSGVGLTTAPPNIWRNGGVEAVMVPVVYAANHPGYDVRLVAFSPTGSLLADIVVTTFVPEVTGGSALWGAILDALPPYGFQGHPVNTSDPARFLPPDTMLPMAGVAVYSFPGGGTPWVIVSDQINDVVCYTFYADGRFIENVRLHDTARAMRSAPAVLPDSHSAVGTDKGVVFGGPSMTKLPPVPGAGIVYAAPTRTAAGRTVVVDLNGLVSFLQGAQVVGTARLEGQSIASAAASRTHVFVSTTGAFATYDTNTMAEVGRVPWVGGGASPPAIGPSGRVYAIASNILFIFPPPSGATQPGRKLPTGLDVAQVAQTQGVAEAGPKVALLQPQLLQATPQPPQPSSQTFQPPLTPSGKRLYACKDFDGHGCGAPVAAVFCQQQGFAHAAKIDTQTAKAPAETLDGRLCDKKKCKVFDLIVCKQ